jgi:uncharacterized protein YprB with RNaseH-like and TPR domain
MVVKNNRSKILFVDIEATNLDANFGYILCIGYKWAHEKDAKVISITDFKRHKQDCTDDREVLKAFSEIYNQADIVVWHYGERFDLPYIQTRLLMNKMPILPVAASVDTWRIARYKLKLNSNRLETLLKALECKYQKSPVDGKMWIRATAGDNKAIKYVVEHCYYDIMVLEEAYNKVKGLMCNHPLVGDAKKERCYTQKDECPSCAKKRLRVYGTTLTASNRYKRLKCMECGRTVKGEVINTFLEADT